MPMNQYCQPYESSLAIEYTYLCTGPLNVARPLGSCLQCLMDKTALLVCTVLGAAASETPSPTEYCVTNYRVAGWYVKNDVIVRKLRVQTIEEYVRSQARRLFDCADEGPILSLHNLAPQYERPPGGYQFPEI
ncbi:hypothetical protein EVAR_8824_1 [Eumeta japonica]|uniref:Uncharacterized protein n=1 Tax=Eumeta variegata TaxID=151549 RepID=A0A4C1TTX9_EUMVA|nr:hypothetical protein EVAR_8824_1 [Eumeta japonica]